MQKGIRIEKRINSLEILPPRLFVSYELVQGTKQFLACKNK